ncbi:hypothetical protein D3C78_1458410 [compost metagenome]
MGVAVDHPVDVVTQHGLLNGLRVDVHNRGGFVLVALLAARTHFSGDLQPPAQGERQKSTLDPGVMNFLAEFLIGLIVGTQGITVQDQDLTAIQLDDLLFR